MSEARRVQGIRKDSPQGNLDLPLAATKPRGLEMVLETFL